MKAILSEVDIEVCSDYTERDRNGFQIELCPIVGFVCLFLFVVLAFSPTFPT